MVELKDGDLVIGLMVEKGKAGEEDKTYTHMRHIRETESYLGAGTDIERFKGENGLIRFTFKRSVKSLSSR